MNIRFANGESWSNTKEFTLSEFKEIISKEQLSSMEYGWCPIFLENHDQPRSVEHFLPGCEDYENGAKALAAMLLTLRGTPFIYEGEEIGMSNVNRDSIDEYNDISSHNQYDTALKNGLSAEEALDCVKEFSRDNARSPMQWNDTLNAGFTTGTPWLALNSNYRTINAASEENDEASVLSWYRMLSATQLETPVFTCGAYKELMKESEEIFAYERYDDDSSAVVLINFTGHDANYDQTLTDGYELILSSRGSDSTFF